ncbi:MAG: hypothetical protein FWC91_02755 [Defluviitaleaceae bacterium]|nr:hypothetical protein [Defluviitaleaceae bacterium]
MVRQTTLERYDNTQNFADAGFISAFDACWNKFQQSKYLQDNNISVLNYEVVNEKIFITWEAPDNISNDIIRNNTLIQMNFSITLHESGYGVTTQNGEKRVFEVGETKPV